MVIIEWDESAWQLYNDYLENAKVAFGRKTALRWEKELLHIYECLKLYPESYPLEELLKNEFPLHRFCHMMHRRFKLIYFYDEAADVVHIMDIWDTRMNPKTLRKRIT